MGRTSFQRFMRRLHPQLPLNNKESQKLLRLLNSEFQTALDEKHPPPTRVPRPHSSGKRFISPHDTTSEYLGSVLANPLLSYSRNNTDGRESERGTHDSGISSSAWQSKVALGTADFQTARDFLATTLRAFNKSGTGERREALKKQTVGTQVLDWLRSSGNELSAEMMLDASFCRMLTTALVAEGQGHFVLNWLKQSKVNDANLDFHRAIVFTYVRTHEKLGCEDDAVVNAWLQCWNSYSPHSHNHNSIFKTGYKRFVRGVFSKRIQLSTQAYERLASTGMEKGFPILEALFALYHRSSPDPHPLVGLLKTHSIEQSESVIGSSIPKSQIPSAACLDAAELLISRSERRQAAWVMKKVNQEVALSPSNLISQVLGPETSHRRNYERDTSHHLAFG